MIQPKYQLVTYYLTTSTGERIVEIEDLGEDFSVHIDIEEYSRLLLEYVNNVANYFERDGLVSITGILVSDFSALQNLRQRWFENQDDFQKGEVKLRDWLKDTLRLFGANYNLNYGSG